MEWQSWSLQNSLPKLEIFDKTKNTLAIKVFANVGNTAIVNIAISEVAQVENWPFVMTWFKSTLDNYGLTQKKELGLR